MSKAAHALASLFVLSWLVAHADLPADEERLLRQADQKYAERTTRGRLEEAIAIYSRAVESTSSYEASWKLARAYWYQANRSPNDAKQEKFALAIQAAKKATEARPGACEGHFWLGVNYGMYAETASRLKALTLVDDVKDALNRAKEIDPNCQCGGPDRVLGRVYAKIPWFKGGSKKKATEYLQRSIQMCPNDTQSRLFLAEIYIETGKKDLALQQLTAILKQEPDPQWIPETKENKILAEKLLNQIEND